MTATYEQVVKAAQRLNTDDTRDTWALADAVLGHVPASTRGGDLSPREGGKLVPNQLADLAAQMKSDGVTTPNGDNYTASSLGHLRDTAVAWPQDERYPNAAYRTHQEAGSPKTEGGKVLAALCSGGNKPRGIDADAWREATTRVAARRKGFDVVANDIRVALKRKLNIPRPMTATDVKQAIKSGDVDVEDVMDALDPKQQDKVEQSARKRRVKREIARSESDMTEKELEDSDKEIEALEAMATAVGGAAKDLGTFHPLEEYTGRAQREMQAGLMIAKKRGHIPNSYEIEAARENLANIRKVADLYEMFIDGQDIGNQAEEWLRAQTA